jgi:hypothetical protein
MKNLKSFKQLFEGRIVYNLNQSQKDSIRIFFDKHKEIKKWMSSFVKSNDTLRDFRKFLTAKNNLESAAQNNEEAKEKLLSMGYRAKHMKSDAFGEKTFFEIDFPQSVMYAELFQYLSDGVDVY